VLTVHSTGPDPLVRAAPKDDAAAAEPRPEAKRAPVPDEATQAKALKLIRDLYKDDYAKKKPQDLLDLAAKLLQEAGETKDDPAARFVLLRESRDLAAQAGNAPACLEAIDELAKGYDIDALAMKAEWLAATSRTATAIGSLPVADTCLGLVDDALAGDHYELALRFLATAADAARKVRSVALSSKIETRRKEVQASQKEFEEVKEARAKLRQTPDDPDANLAVGKYLCLVKADWKKGLPLLAKGSDAALKAVAEKEADQPAEAEAQVRLGDGWWDLAGKAMGRTKAALLARALYWYEQALPQLKGLAKARVEKRLQEAVALAPQGPALRPGGLGGRSEAARERLVRDGGGTKESEAAVSLGLQWLANHQAPDGRWSLSAFSQHGKCNCTGAGNTPYEIAATAFGVLPFLGAGVTHQSSGKHPAHSRVVLKGLNFLLARQQRDGSFSGNMYENGLATMALCEAYGMTADPKLKGPAQRAVNFLVFAQHSGGGWRYRPREAGDTSVTGWQFMALKTAQMAGLSVPKETFKGVSRFLDSVAETDGSGYGYINTSAAPTTTAVGLLCREYLGVGPRDADLLKGVDRLKRSPPDQMARNIYYCYYATEVMHHLGGEHWEFWNPKMRDLLIDKQDKGNDGSHPHHKGSWSPAGDQQGPIGGRIMVTSLSLLTLEVYYRHVPLHGRDKGAGPEKKEP
jgi:hypothetical protein